MVTARLGVVLVVQVARHIARVSRVLPSARLLRLGCGRLLAALTLMVIGRRLVLLRRLARSVGRLAQCERRHRPWERIVLAGVIRGRWQWRQGRGDRAVVRIRVVVLSRLMIRVPSTYGGDGRAW